MTPFLSLSRPALSSLADALERELKWTRQVGQRIDSE